MQLTYFISLTVFLFPPVLMLLVIAFIKSWKRSINSLNFRPWFPFLLLSAMVLIAVTYTTPWDNYLVATGVWWYNIDLVSGVLIGFVPIEEYMFFVLQTFLTGLGIFAIWNLKREKAQVDSNSGRARYWIALLFALLWIVSTYLMLFGEDLLNYLTLIISWALIPIIIQIVFGGDILWANRKPLTITISLTTIYLWIMDSISIKAGIWTIDPEQTVGLGIGNLPIEEMLFFLFTNILISFGMTLLLSPISKVRAKSIVVNIHRTSRSVILNTTDV